MHELSLDDTALAWISKMDMSGCQVCISTASYLYEQRSCLPSFVGPSPCKAHLSNHMIC